MAGMFLSPGSKLPIDVPLISQISLAKHKLFRLSRQEGAEHRVPSARPFGAEAPVRPRWSHAPERTLSLSGRGQPPIMNRGAPCQTVTLLCPRPTPHHPPGHSLPALLPLWTAGPAEPRGLRPGGQATLEQDISLSSRDVARGTGKRRWGAQHPPATPWNRRAPPWPHFCFSWKSLRQALGLARSIRKPCVQRTDSAEPLSSARLSLGPRSVPWVLTFPSATGTKLRNSSTWPTASQSTKSSTGGCTLWACRKSRTT